ncbi:MAG TPA: cytochrome c biogenesis protein CcdA [Kofleriaceae bacterium]|nr:cytochrome c biogenesis protein CcdA [Kofleriaceae bacterium]
MVLTAVVAIPTIALAASCSGDAASFEEAKKDGWLAAYITAFGAGFATSLTPCVYPMIPIVLGIFGARGKDVSRWKAIALASLYVLGMGVTFTALGVIFALIGTKSGTLLADPRFVIPIVILYLVLAASMFGAFELNLPASWQAKLSSVGGQGYGGAFAMGLVGGFTAAPCTGPFLGGLLVFVTQSRDVVIGGSLLFTYAIGMGVLFFALAAFAISLPKSGRWMEWVKSGGGVALLAVALYFLRPIVPAIREWGEHNFGFLMASVAIAALGLGLGAIHLSFHDSAKIKARKSAAVVLAVAGIFSIVSYFLAVTRELPWIHDDEPKAFAQAKAAKKGVMIDFGATWCGACNELEHTFAADGVAEGITAQFVPLKLDVSKGSDRDTELQERYKAETLPAVIFLDASGKELGRVSSYVDAEDFHCVLDPAAATIKKTAGAISAR